ncbi:MAG: hypothetical protein MRY63_03180 [Neomegalonema sp.]|nr:hypothetical protein [Neomegalonema sp.]
MMMGKTVMRIASALLALVLAAMVSGCAFGNKYDYSTAQMSLGSALTQDVAVAVVDERPYIVSGDKDPDFVGLQRGGYGNPFDVTTVSGQPLAQDMTVMLTNSLKNAGAQAVPVLLEPGTSYEAARSKALGLGKSRTLLLEMDEWKSDVAIQVTMHWNLTARIYDANNQLLAEENISGNGGSGEQINMLPSSNGEVAIRQAQKHFSELLSRPSIAAALGK